jgi:GntR family transcriptional regulator
MDIDTSTRQEQVKRYIIDHIKRNHLGQGDRFPPEAEMARQIGVSRNTVREVYITLEGEGILIRRHGIGTFLARVPLVTETATAGFSSYPNLIRQAGYIPSFKTLSIESKIPPAESCPLFGISKEDSVVCVKRIILANEMPTVYLIDYLSPEVKQEAEYWGQFTGDMIELLTAHLGFDLAYLQVKYRAVLVEHDVAASLGLSEGLPIMSSRSKLFSLDNRLVAYGISYLNPEIIDLDLTRIINPKKTH